MVARYKDLVLAQKVTLLSADYVLHFQVEGGDWQQKTLSTNSNKYTLDGLRCGSLYKFYMTATNSLGTAEPRDIIYGRTRGAGKSSVHVIYQVLCSSVSDAVIYF